jgi:hypothetical protein
VFVFETNELGLRGKNLTAAKKPPGTYRIFFVGGSTTENPSTEESKTFPALVETELNARLGGAPRVEVGNAAISGNLAAQTLAHVMHRLLPLEPDLIVDLEVNDFYYALSEGWDPSTYDMRFARRARFRDWLLESCRLFALFAETQQDELHDAKALYLHHAALRRARARKDPDDATLLRGRERFRETLRDIALVCEDAGVPLVQQTAVWLYKPEQPKAEDDVLWMSDLARYNTALNLTSGCARRAMDAQNEVIREVARERETRLVDLDRLVPHDLAHLVDDCHFATKGQETAAKAIVEKLLEGGKLPGRTKR